MYERRLVGHTTKNATLLSDYEDISTGKEQLIQLRSYDTIVARIMYFGESALIFAENPYEWSNTTIKHIGWFCDDINSRLGLDLCYYDFKFMAIKDNFKLIIEPKRVYYYDDKTGEVIFRDSWSRKYAANHSFERRESGYYLMGMYPWY